MRRGVQGERIRVGRREAVGQGAQIKGRRYGSVMVGEMHILGVVDSYDLYLARKLGPEIFQPLNAVSGSKALANALGCNQIKTSKAASQALISASSIAQTFAPFPSKSIRPPSETTFK